MNYEEQFQKIEDSYYFRRLKNIMLLIPTENDDRKEGEKQNRQTHTKDVVRISEKIVGRIGGDKDLTRVIAISHDLGHLPYAHYGEVVMRSFGDDLRLRHEENGPLLYEEIIGKDLKQEVVDGIREHRFLNKPHSSKESWIVNYADEIASFVSNIRDGLYLGDCFDYEDFKKQAQGVLGIFPGVESLEDSLVDKVDLVSPGRLTKLFKLVEKYWSKFGEHERVRAENLNIEQRMRNYHNLVMFDRFGTGFTSQDFIDRKLLMEGEIDMSLYEDYEKGKDWI